MGKFTSVMIAPGRYVQGRGAMYELGDHLSAIGCKKALVVGGKTGLAVTKPGRDQSFEEKGIEQIEELFTGEVTYQEIERIKDLAIKNNCDAIIASGGGKTMDTVKAAADKANVATVILPTIASTDAPTSALAVVYDEQGVFVAFYIPKRNPDIVLVDTEIIAHAPVRLLVAGMGDALATWFEADACNRACSINLPGGQPTATAIAVAKLCFDILMEYGLQAKIAAENNSVTPALEKVVEANTLLSGIGFESGGLAAAHSLQDGFTIFPEIHHYYHGEKVAFLTLAQLVLENRAKETIQQVFEFCNKVGLPTTLADLAIDKVGPEKIMEAVTLSCLPGKIMHNHAFPVNEQMVFDAIVVADAMGRRIKQGFPIV